MNHCLIIPHFNHFELFELLLPKLKALNLPCVIVDDGSDTSTLTKLREATKKHNSFYLVEHSQNRGKGAAVITATYYARSLGFSHGIQVDADGQHDLNDIGKFIEYSQQHPDTIISGKPYFEDSAPKVRVYGRRITDFWVALETLSFKIKDSLCGFRVYPFDAIEKIIDSYHLGPRMDFDTEILVKSVWSNIPLHFIPTKVIYHDQSVSHFRYLQDNWLLILLHCRLLLGMSIRLPWLVPKRVLEMIKT